MSLEALLGAMGAPTACRKLPRASVHWFEPGLPRCLCGEVEAKEEPEEDPSVGLSDAMLLMLDRAVDEGGSCVLHGSGQRSTAKALERRGWGRFELRERHPYVPSAHFVLNREERA